MTKKPTETPDEIDALQAEEYRVRQDADRRTKELAAQRDALHAHRRPVLVACEKVRLLREAIQRAETYRGLLNTVVADQRQKLDRLLGQDMQPTMVDLGFLLESDVAAGNAFRLSDEIERWLAERRKELKAATEHAEQIAEAAGLKDLCAKLIA